MKFKAEIFGPNNRYTVIENATLADLKGYCRTIDKHYSGYADFSLAAMELNEVRTFETPRNSYKFTKVIE